MLVSIVAGGSCFKINELQQYEFDFETPTGIGVQGISNYGNWWASPHLKGVNCIDPEC